MEQLQALLPLVFLFGIFYLLLIRPQKKRMQQHQALIESVGLGDEVVTIGGVFGTVAALRDAEIELEVAPGTKIRILRSAIARKIDEDIDADLDADEDADEADDEEAAATEEPTPGEERA
ncbi:MAG: preprotein translocase subunit YajC [Actinomycetota bacterium]|nr:preprotein translocase subunit YajC [Actinomycetota bacterium]